MIIVLVLGLGCFMAYHYVNFGQTLHGLYEHEGQEVLASRARPAFYFVPSKDFNLQVAGWQSVRSPERRLEAETVRLNLAIYQRQKPKAELITALAECPGEWEWIPAHHSPYPTLRAVDEPYGSQRLYEFIYLLAADKDPLGECPATKQLLVYRAKFLPFFRKMQVLFEYREELTPELARNLDLKPEVLRAFAERARHSCQVNFLEQSEAKSFKPPLQKLTVFEEKFSRDRLGFWLGELKHPGGNR